MFVVCCLEICAILHADMGSLQGISRLPGLRAMRINVGVVDMVRNDFPRIEEGFREFTYFGWSERLLKTRQRRHILKINKKMFNIRMFDWFFFIYFCWVGFLHICITLYNNIHYTYLHIYIFQYFNSFITLLEVCSTFFSSHLTVSGFVVTIFFGFLSGILSWSNSSS